MLLKRSADWQSAVSQVGNLRGADGLPTASRRYSRLPVCATVRLPPPVACRKAKIGKAENRNPNSKSKSWNA